MTALAKLSEYSHDEDDSQYSSLALLCMKEYLVPFSQQLLQTTFPSESSAEVSVCFLSHAVSHQGGNLLADLLCVPHVI